MVDGQNACEPTRNEFPWICISGALNWPKQALAGALEVQNQGASALLNRLVFRLFRHRLALSDRTQHRHQHCVEAVGTFDVLSRAGRARAHEG